MIIVRNVFQLKFGKAKEGTEVWKEGLTLAKRLGFAGKSRVLTDLVGQFYTIVFETAFESLGDFETSAKKIMSNAEWQSWYQKISAITESGHREILNVVAEQ